MSDKKLYCNDCRHLSKNEIVQEINVLQAVMDHLYPVDKIEEDEKHLGFWESSDESNDVDEYVSSKFHYDVAAKIRSLAKGISSEITSWQECMYGHGEKKSSMMEAQNAVFEIEKEENENSSSE